MKVLGIDPGTLNLGWGFIETNAKGEILRVEHDTISAPAKASFFDRLHRLSQELDKVVRHQQPEVAVIEKIFLGKSVDSAFKLGHVRGICAAHCREVGAQIHEYAARTIKKQITGAGNADKLVVQNFLYQQLGLRGKPPSHDASDALALAFCHVLQDTHRSRIRGIRPQ